MTKLSLATIIIPCDLVSIRWDFDNWLGYFSHFVLKDYGQSKGKKQVGIPSSSGSEPGSALLACDFPVNGPRAANLLFFFFYSQFFLSRGGGNVEWHFRNYCELDWNFGRPNLRTVSSTGDGEIPASVWMR